MRNVGEKKGMVVTGRMKIIVITVITTIIIILRINFWLGVIAILFPVVPIVIAGIMYSPFDRVLKMWISRRVHSKLKVLKDTNKLIVVGISGSYGKTSVKEYLYQILSSKYRVVRTPESYNTLLGIAKVVDLEVDETTQMLICEMGAFRKGEIEQLCEMVMPDYAMLTGLNEQHLERFGSLENEIEGESESVQYVLDNRRTAVVNIGNKYIKDKWNEVPGVVEYGEGSFTTPMQQNIAGAKVMARVIGMALHDIEEAAKNLRGAKHRLTLIDRGDIKVIDDAYSSNTDGFRVAIRYLNTFAGRKVIVTPGIVELGSETARIHQELGEYMRGKVDQVVLVGKNERTENLEKGFGGQVEYIGDVRHAMDLVKVKPAVVLFENDLADNY